MDSLTFFRRNLKPLMAAMTVMAMISFVFLDDRPSGGGGGGRTFLVPLILAFLFGGGAFVWGTRKSKQNEYGTMGAVVGAVLGLVIMQFGGRDTSEQPPIAGLSQRDIANLKSRRESANRILSEIFMKSHPVPEQFANNEGMRRFYQAQILGPQLQQIQFSFGNNDFEKDVIFGDLLRREAMRLGIIVNDDAVNDYMQMVSEQKITSGMFKEIAKQLRIGIPHAYDLLREELAARMAAEMTFPKSVSTPQQRWQDFRKVNVKQSIEATTIPVKDFTKSVPEPTDDQLRAFFQKHAEKPPGFRGEHGFFQPMRVRLAYLEADYDLIEKKVEVPTDEVVAKFYEDNKELFADRTPVKTDDKKDDATEGDESKKPDDKKEGDKPDSDKPADDKKGDDKKGDDKPKPEPKESEKSEKPSEPKSDKPAEVKDEKPKEEKPADKSKSDDSQGAAGEDKVAGEKPDEPKPADPPKKAEQKAEGDPKDAPKADTKKPDDKEAEKKTDAKPDDAKKAEDKKPEDKPKSETPESKDKPAADTEKPDKTDDKSEEKTEKKPETKYKPFEEVKDKILDDLLRERTLKLMKEQIEKVISDREHGMRRLGSYTIAAKGEKPRRSAEEVASELKEFAESLDLKYVETPMLSAEELSNKSEDFKIGRATDPSDETFNRQGVTTVLQRVFGGGNDSTFTPEVAEDPGTKNRFAYWVIDRKEAHVPKFDEEGIRQQVTKAWKLEQATPKAEERAKALAKLAAEGQKLTEVMAGQTVTGEKDGLQLTVVESKEKFAHYTMSGASAPGVRPFQPGNERVELTQIPGLDKLGDEFFSAVDRMKPGTTAAIPNFDRSAFIVVHITDREDIAAEEDAPQRSDFLKSWLFSPSANQLASLDFDPLRREWMESIERKYNVKWPVK